MSPDEIMALFRESDTAHDVLTSVTWIAAVALVRLVALRLVRSQLTAGDPVTLRATVQVKRTAIVIIVLGLGLIWATELQTMALSLTAIAVAIVVATKEMLLCVMGSVLRASAKSFTVGDRVELAGVRGDVIDHGLFATTIVEVGPGHRWTGRSVTVPNSVMLISPVINETYSHAFVLHFIAIPVDAAVDLDAAEACLIEAATLESSKFFDDACAALRRDAESRALEAPITDPHVIVEIPKAGECTLLLRLPVPARDKGEVEQAILRRFLSWSAQSARETSLATT